MIRKKPIFVLVLLLTSLLVNPGYGGAESTGSSLNMSPAYLGELRSLVAGLLQQDAGLQEEEVIHVVARGETLTNIAQLYDMSVEDLVAINGIRDRNLILVDQELKVTFPCEIKHTLARGDTLASLALVYGAELEAIKEANNALDPFTMPVGTVVTIPNPTRLPPPVPVVTVASRTGSTALSSGRIPAAPHFTWPLHGTITSRFGVLRTSGYHWGLDIAAPTGTPIKAAAGGVVSFSGYRSSYGNMVIIDHGSGWTTLYAHASRLLVSKGQRVSQGERIALVGESGNATGPHAHLEVAFEGKRLNPETHLRR